MSFKARTTTPLWGHQREGVEFVMERHGGMLGIGMGGGKSLSAIEIAVRLKSRYTLIVCPLSVLGVWRGQFRQHSDGFHVVVVGEGTNLKKAKDIYAAYMWGNIHSVPVVIVVSYMTAWRNPTRATLLKLIWDLVIFDESHKIKNPSGRASEFCDRLRLTCKKRLALTGTPTPHSPLDIFAQARALDPRVFGKSYTAFRNRYAEMGGPENVQVVGFKNTKEYHEKFHSIVFLRKTSECVDLPPISHQVIPVALSPKAAKLYRDLEENFYAGWDSGEITAKNVLVKLLRLQQLTSGIAKYDDGSQEQVCTAKIDALRDILEGVSEDEGPVVVFSRFTPDVQNTIELGRELGWKTGEISSAVKDLTSEAKLIHGVRLQSVQIQSGGVGIDLSDSSIGVYISTGFSLGDYDQSLARLHRPGQKRHTRFYHVIATNTIDVRVRYALKRRRDVIEEIIARKPIDEREVLEEKDG